MPTEQEIQEVNHNFKYHAPTEAEVLKYELLRDIYRDVALTLLNFCPPSRERSVAITNLEQSLMWANASIARSAEDIAEDTVDTEAQAKEFDPTNLEDNDGN